jgi:hypothetical protein
MAFADGAVGYPTAVTQVLATEGFLGSMPLQQLSEVNYMIFICNNNQQYSLSATLSNATAANIANVQTLCNGTGINGAYTRYDKNYGLGN